MVSDRPDSSSSPSSVRVSSDITQSGHRRWTASSRAIMLEDKCTTTSSTSRNSSSSSSIQSTSYHHLPSTTTTVNAAKLSEASNSSPSSTPTSSSPAVGSVPKHVDADAQSSDIQLNFIENSSCLPAIANISHTSSNFQTSAISKKPPASSQASRRFTSSSFVTKMCHLAQRNPLSLVFTLFLIFLSVLFLFAYGPLTANALATTPAAQKHPPNSQSETLIEFLESNFNSKNLSTTAPAIGESESLESEASETHQIFANRGKSKDAHEVEEVVYIDLSSPSRDADVEDTTADVDDVVGDENVDDDYDERPETVPVLRSFSSVGPSQDETREPASASYAKLVDYHPPHRPSPLPKSTRSSLISDSSDQVKNYILKFLASKAASHSSAETSQKSETISRPRTHSLVAHSAASTPQPSQAGSSQEALSPRFSTPARDLSSPSQRIAKLFQDLRSSKVLNESASEPQARGGDLKPQFCGEVLNITTSIEISSPNYPEKYLPNLDCRWEVFAKKEQTLRVQIFKLNIEQDQFCRFDYLDVKGIQPINKKSKQTANKTKRYCGSYANEEIPIVSNHVSIHFHSDGNTEHNGFYLRVMAESQDCVSTIHVLNSTFVTSPKYPSSYDDSKTCWTLVTAQPNHRLFVQFEVLRLEPDPQCMLDYVQVYDGRSVNESKSLGRYCTKPDHASVSLHSSNDSLLFHFESDNFLALLGYKARVVSLRRDVSIDSYANCNWNADWQNMTIASPFYPNRYPPGTECQTSITSASPEERIIILFDWIDLIDNIQPPPATTSLAQNGRSTSNEQPNNGPHCSSDRLEIWESLTDKTPSNVLCGYRTKPFKFVSKSNSIRLLFRSARAEDDETTTRQRSQIEGPNNNPGFKARFTFIASKSDTPASLNKNNIENTTTVPSGQDEDSSSDVQLPTPILHRKPENASVMIGSSHILFCELSPGENGQKPQIIWFKGDREIHEGVSSDGSSLLIQQFLPSSVGRYICVYGDNSSDAWLTAMYEDDECSSTNVLFRERPKDQYTSEGEFMLLQCAVTVTDPISGEEKDAKITWKKLDFNAGGKLTPVEFNSRIKVLRRGDIIFDPALVDDSGFYFCVVHINNTKNGEERQCTIQSAARVQINQRVDVSQYCGRAVVKQKAAAKNPMRRESISDYGKIIGGTEAESGEFPWMVMFWDDKRHVFCGGALLNERWVMTAAHCFTDATDQSTVFVKLGKNDQTIKEPTEVVSKIQDIIRHPNFSKDTFDNDIALIKLSSHITFTDYVLPICLPSSSEEVDAMKQFFFSDNLENTDESAETRFGYVTGWGRLKESGPLPRFLHKIRLPIVEEQRCHEMTSFKVTDNMFCAGYGKEVVGDACKGDSGGPFTVYFNDRWTLLGVVSWGEGCGRQEKFGYYTKVSNYISWIRRLTRHTY